MIANVNNGAMKKIYYTMAVVLILLLTTCEKRAKLNVYSLDIKSATVTTTTTSADLTVKFSYPTELEYVNTHLSIYGDMSYATIVESDINDDVFTASFDNLAANTRYFYLFEYSNGVNVVKTGLRSFVTMDFSLPIVETSEVTSIGSNSAVCGGQVQSAGDGTISARGICWSSSPEPTLSDNVLVCGDGLGEFSATMTNLEIYSTYYVRAYATNEKGTAFGEVKSFTTAGVVPTLSTNQASMVTFNSAVSGGNVIDDGFYEITEKGVCWSSTGTPYYNDAHTSDGTGMGTFISHLTDLSPNVVYYVRAYAVNSQGIGYGNEVSFTTLMTYPTVTTKNVSDVTETSAMCGGNILSDGGLPIIRRGVCWSTTHYPTIDSDHTSDGTGTGEFTSEITGLTPNVTYYVRAYAASSYAVSYGEEMEFVTGLEMPVVTTAEVTDITATSASCGGEVISDGGGTITARGVCWSHERYPTIEGDHTTDGEELGEFTSLLTNLDPGTTYYVRAYVTNARSISYGEELSFNTMSGLAYVETKNVTNIGSYTADCGGENIEDGGSNIVSKGVCWSTSPNPIASNSHTSDGSGTASYTSHMGGLLSNTTYYVRAYVNNGIGYSYGEEKTFTTNLAVPRVITLYVNNITETSVTFVGSVTHEGDAPVTARGVCWGKSSEPTIYGYHTTDGEGLGQFSSNIENLEPNTLYYVRAYATNSAGTGYGATMTFTTKSFLPIVETGWVSSSTSLTVIVSANKIISEGAAPVTAKGVCWCLEPLVPTIEDSHSNEGSGPDAFISYMTGLSANHTYYFRAYATNSYGTAYGELYATTTQKDE